MKLTGKCKEKFLDYLRDNKKSSIELGFLKLHWQAYPEKYLNALIIEFFDSVGIYIKITDYDGEDYWCEINGLGYSILKPTRTEATNAAIEKANKLYNQNK